MPEPRRSGPSPSSPRAPLRVLHYPTDVGGNPVALSRAERRLGANSTVAVLQRSPIGYEIDIDLALGDRGKLRRLAGRAAFAARSLRRYDVFHFNFGQTMLPRLGSWGIDLPLLRAIGKRIIMTFQGCDARQQRVCAAQFQISCCGREQGPGLCRPQEDPGKRRAIAYARRYCHRLFCVNPDLLHVVPQAEFLPYTAIDPNSVEPVPPRGDGPITVLHAPSNRAIKGTEAVLEAVATLRRRHDVRLLLVEGQEHQEALRRYREADLVIDQLRVGWYGALAVELMAMGKPVVCYIREQDLQFVPAAMARELPVVRADAGSLASVLDDLVSSPSRLATLGAASRRYVERWHDPLRIARRMLEIYADPGRPFWDDSGYLSP